MRTEMFSSTDPVNRFERKSFSGKERFTSIGTGSLGAKARGLADIGGILESRIAPRFGPAILIDIPRLTVIATDSFDRFMEENGLFEIAASARTDEEIARAFQKSSLPEQLTSDLRVFVAHIRVPLAVRSSSLLEDAVHEPLAGVYVTKMIPNNQPDLEDRLRNLSDVIKYVYASTYFKKAKDFLRATRHRTGDEKMAVIIQEVVGIRYNNRFYPQVSGVARSFNFYPIGLSRPGDGVVELALGLGKIIVDDGIAWSVSPAYPHVNPPYNTLRDLLKRTQREFWAIDMTVRETRHAVDETEHLKKYTLVDAEHDGALSFIASTYEIENERIVMGITGRDPRIVDFGQILKAELIPLTALLKEALKACEQSLGTAVEIEFAMTLSHPHATPARFGFLQVRPMVISHAQVDVHPEELNAPTALVASESALGNGTETAIRDVVYVRPRALDTAHTRIIERELEAINQRLVGESRPYVLIGFGRWGSSDPSVGIPVNFAQISGARVIVETTLPNTDFILSQGSHFFHNITSSKVLYFSVSHTGKFRVDWRWLEGQPAAEETEFTRHVRLASPLNVKVDGRTNRGVIQK